MLRAAAVAMSVAVTSLGFSAGCSSGARPAAIPDAGPNSTAPARPATCVGREGSPGDYRYRIHTASGLREYLLHVPPAYRASEPVPLVLNFHGFGSDPDQQELISRMTHAADARGLILAYPRGRDASWNAGLCCGESLRTNLDDVQFVRDVLAFVERDYCIDTRRIYATGMSNGGFMAYRLACEMSDRIAAVASVSGMLGIRNCSPERPVAVLHFHGTGDALVPFDGDPTRGFPSAHQTIARWEALDACPSGAIPSARNGEVECASRSGCAGGTEVALCVIDGGGHTWPGGPQLPFTGLGATTRDVDATETILDFFARHALP
jgi:polyhydroxybutyrate depolymerase